MNEDALFCVGQKAFIEKDGKVLILNDPGEGLDDKDRFDDIANRIERLENKS